MNNNQFRDSLHEAGVVVLNIKFPTKGRICMLTRDFRPRPGPDGRSVPGPAVIACVDDRRGWQDEMFAKLTAKYRTGQVLTRAEFEDALNQEAGFPDQHGSLEHPSTSTRFEGVFGEPVKHTGPIRETAPELDQANHSSAGHGVEQKRLWSDLGPEERDLLAEFLLAVNSEVAFADGRMTAKEANVEPFFQRIVARSRGDLIRQALFHLHDQYDRLGRGLADEAASSGQGLASYGYATSRLEAVADLLASVDLEEGRRYLMAVWFTGVATAEADGPFFGPKMSPEEREGVDAIVLPLAAHLGYSEADILRWAREGAG